MLGSFKVWHWVLVGLAVWWFALLFGCDTSGTQGGITLDNVLDALEEGEATGNLVITTGGSPLAVGMKQVFFAGPENASLSFDGHVDFRPGVAEVPRGEDVAAEAEAAETKVAEGEPE